MRYCYWVILSSEEQQHMQFLFPFAQNRVSGVDGEKKKKGLVGRHVDSLCHVFKNFR